MSSQSTSSGMQCRVDWGHMEVLGVRRSERHTSTSGGRHPNADAVDLASCSVQELLQLQNCCHLLSQVISRRIAQMPGVNLSGQADAGSHGRLVLTRSSLLAHRDASSRSGDRRCSCSLPQHLEGDLGLWQAIQQELFPKPVKTRPSMEASSRDDNQGPTSPGMLSVVTAPSDGGTTRGQRPCARSSLRTQLHHADNLSQVAANTASQHARCAWCSPAHDKPDDSSTPVSSVCGDGSNTDTAAVSDGAQVRLVRSTVLQGNGIPVHKPVAPIPECNSSLETAGSTGFTASNGTAQLQFGRPCGSAFTSSSEGPMLLSFHKPAAECAAADAAATLQPLPDGPSTQTSGSCSSVSPRCDRRRQRKRDSATPPVQYGFPASPRHASTSNSPGSAGGSGHPTRDQYEGPAGFTSSLLDKEMSQARKRCPGVGPRPPTGLLSASLSQANSAGTSPRAAVASPLVTRSAGLPNSVWPKVTGTYSEPLQLSASNVVEAKCGGSAHSVPASTKSPNPDVLSNSAIPRALIAEMACMGFHRPLRVGSNQALSESCASD
eukprot:jgi/Ulvmu1/254/UM001_0258.1